MNLTISAIFNKPWAFHKSLKSAISLLYVYVDGLLEDDYTFTKRRPGFYRARETVRHLCDDLAF